MLSVEADLLGQMSHSADAQGLIDDISGQVKTLSTEIHKLSYQLHPAKLEQLGLVLATRSLCSEQGKLWKMEVEFTQVGIPRSLNRLTALSLYRIVQESLTNAGRHGNATRASVELEGRADDITLLVVDNGQGFDLLRVDQHAGLGLVGMRERVRLLNGRIDFNSTPGKGTRIQVTVPLDLEVVVG